MHAFENKTSLKYDILDAHRAYRRIKLVKIVSTFFKEGNLKLKY